MKKSIKNGVWGWRVCGVFWWFERRGGQALVELLVGMGIAVVLLGSAAAITRMIVRSNSDVQKTQVATNLARELIDNARVLADSDWGVIFNLNKGSENKYYINTGVNPFAVVSGVEEVVVDGESFERYFFIDNVNRSAGDDSIVEQGGVMDPATQKLTVNVNWGGVEGIYFEEYLVRHRNFIFHQTDWSGGLKELNPSSSAGSTFATSTNIYYDEAGSIRLE